MKDQVERFRLLLGRRGEERELRARLSRHAASGPVPMPDHPLERPAERVDVATGRLLDRRRRARAR